MNHQSAYATGRNDILRRLQAIDARVRAANCRARDLFASTDEKEERRAPSDGDPLHHLEQIESNLQELEDRLRKVEEQMRENESPPHTFGTTNQFSTGPHFPGIG